MRSYTRKKINNHFAGCRSWYNRVRIRDALAEIMALELVPARTDPAQSYTVNDSHFWPLGAI